MLLLMTYCVPREMLGSEMQELSGQETESQEVRVTVLPYKT